MFHSAVGAGVFRPVIHLMFLALAGILPALPAHGNATGSDFQLFNPTSTPVDYVTVHSTSTLGAGRWSLGLFANHAVNSLPYFQEDGTRSSDDASRSYRNGLTGMDMSFGFGVLDNLDIGVFIPRVVYQHVKDDDAYHAEFDKSGIYELRVNSKLRLLKMGIFGLGLMGTLNMPQIENNPYTGNDPANSFALEGLFDVDLGKLTLGFNAGYRWREDGDQVTDTDGTVPMEPVENQTLVSGAAGYRLTPKTKAMVEVYGGRTGTDGSEISTRDSSSAWEGIVGLKHAFQENLTGQTGVGSEVRHGVATPDVRFYAGLHWTNAGKRRRTVEKPPVYSKFIILSDILFKFNSAELAGPASEKKLEKVAMALKGPRGLHKLYIEGHTCVIGNKNYNLDLSRRRAAAIKKHLVEKHGIAASKVVTRGFGEEKPVASNRSVDGRRLNRRVEFKLYFLKNSRQARN